MIWLFGPALAAGVTTYVVAMVTKPPGTCKMRVKVGKSDIKPGSTVQVTISLEAVAGPLEIGYLRLCLVQGPAHRDLRSLGGSLLEPEDVVLHSQDLEVPRRMEAGEKRDFECQLTLPQVDVDLQPAVEAQLHLADRQGPPVKARRLLRLG